MEKTLLIFAAFSGNPEPQGMPNVQAFSEIVQTQRMPTPMVGSVASTGYYGMPIPMYSVTTCANGQCSTSVIPPAEVGFRPFGGFFRRR